MSNESFCRAQIPVRHWEQLLPSRKGIQALNWAGWGVLGSSSGAGCWDGAGSTEASPLSAAARPLLVVCCFPVLSTSGKHPETTEQSPAPSWLCHRQPRGENLNLAALGGAGAGWEVWAGAWVGEAHPKPSVQLLFPSLCTLQGSLSTSQRTLGEQISQELNKNLL